MAGFRYLKKNENLNERQIFSDQWKEQIEIYGQEVDFYVNNTTLSSASVLYGEDPGAGYSDPQKLLVLLNINNDAYLLSKFGIVADSDLSGVIHPEHFTTIYGVSSEPKAGDLIRLTEFGEDRLNYPRRGPMVYEITEVVDEFQLNAIAGHYVWFWKARRYDFSMEPNSPTSGMGNTPPDDNDKIENASQENFDYEVDNPCSDTNVYGDY